MFASNLSGFSHDVWGNNPYLQVGSPKIGILGKIYAARNMVPLWDRVELQFSSVLEAEPSVLSEISTEHLKFYAGMLDCYARLNSITERAVTAYRDPTFWENPSTMRKKKQIFGVLTQTQKISIAKSTGR